MPLTPAEKQKRYREKLKRENPEKFKEMKKKIAKCALLYYRQKSCQYTENEKEERRQKWRDERKKQKQAEQEKEKMKSRRLEKHEVLYLLDQIAKQKIITSKITNATHNKLKEEAWKSLARKFSAMVGEPWHPEQLRLKWDNLKKAAKKRIAMIQENNQRTEGKIIIPSDEVLDRVAAILLTAGDEELSTDAQESETTFDTDNVQFLPYIEDVYTLSQEEEGGEYLTLSSDESGAENNSHFTPKKETAYNIKSPPSIRLRLMAEVKQAQRDKELAIAAYFRAKARNVELENIKLEIEIEELKKNCT